MRCFFSSHVFKRLNKYLYGDSIVCCVVGVVMLAV